MGYIEKNLIPGEHVVFKTRLHTITILSHVTIGLLLVVFGFFSFYKLMSVGKVAGNQTQIWTITGGASILIGALTVIWALMKRNATEMAVTNRRVLIKTGLASRRTLELLLQNVESIVIIEPFLGRLLGYGTVIVRGTGGTPEPFDRIARATQFRRCVQEQTEAVQGK